VGVLVPTWRDRLSLEMRSYLESGMPEWPASGDLAGTMFLLLQQLRKP